MNAGKVSSEHKRSQKTYYFDIFFSIKVKLILRQFLGQWFMISDSSHFLNVRRPFVRLVARIEVRSF